MGGQRNNLTELRKIIPDPYGQTAGLVPVVTTYTDDRGLTQYIYTLQAVAPGSAQTKIQFQYNSINLGTIGTVDTFDVASSWATFDRVGNTVTLTIPTPSSLTSPLTTKGDVWGFSTVDARIPVGADNTVLTADSTQPLGVKWGAASSYTPPVTTKGDLFGFSTVPARFPVGSNAQKIRANSAQALGVEWTDVNRIMAFGIDGGGIAITAGTVSRPVRAKGNFTVKLSTIFLNPGSAAGSCVLDVLTSTYANYDTGTSIVASAPPTLSSAIKNQDSTLTGWTTSIVDGNFYWIKVTSASGVTNVGLDLGLIEAI